MTCCRLVAWARTASNSFVIPSCFLPCRARSFARLHPLLRVRRGARFLVLDFGCWRVLCCCSLGLFLQLSFPGPPGRSSAFFLFPHFFFLPFPVHKDKPPKKHHLILHSLYQVLCRKTFLICAWTPAVDPGVVPGDSCSHQMQ